jgi:hypothetical protein
MLLHQIFAYSNVYIASRETTSTPESKKTIYETESTSQSGNLTSISLPSMATNVQPGQIPDLTIDEQVEAFRYQLEFKQLPLGEMRRLLGIGTSLMNQATGTDVGKKPEDEGEDEDEDENDISLPRSQRVRRSRLSDSEEDEEDNGTPRGSGRLRQKYRRLTRSRTGKIARISYALEHGMGNADDDDERQSSKTTPLDQDNDTPSRTRRSSELASRAEGGNSNLITQRQPNGIVSIERQVDSEDEEDDDNIPLIRPGSGRSGVKLPIQSVIYLLLEKLS